jgi:hypothetical protein
MAAELGRVPPEGLGCRCPSNFGFLGLCAHRGFACTQRFALTLPRIASYSSKSGWI